MKRGEAPVLVLQYPSGRLLRLTIHYSIGRPLRPQDNRHLMSARANSKQLNRIHKLDLSHSVTHSSSSETYQFPDLILRTLRIPIGRYNEEYKLRILYPYISLIFRVDLNYPQRANQCISTGDRRTKYEHYSSQATQWFHAYRIPRLRLRSSPVMLPVSQPTLLFIQADQVDVCL
ncbi:MAG: hypothetical protein RIQ72_110 [Candidatus Parcubacteria bacterium]|jgi:hypothetical protein